MTGTPYPKFYKRYIDTFGPKKGLEMVRRPHTLTSLSLCPHFRNGALDNRWAVDYVPMRRVHLPIMDIQRRSCVPMAPPLTSPFCVAQYKAMRRWRDEHDMDHIIDKPYPVSSTNNSC